MLIKKLMDSSRNIFFIVSHKFIENFWTKVYSTITREIQRKQSDLHFNQKKDVAPVNEIRRIICN